MKLKRLLEKTWSLMQFTENLRRQYGKEPYSMEILFKKLYERRMAADLGIKRIYASGKMVGVKTNMSRKVFKLITDSMASDVHQFSDFWGWPNQGINLCVCVCICMSFVYIFYKCHGWFNGWPDLRLSWNAKCGVTCGLFLLSGVNRQMWIRSLHPPATFSLFYGYCSCTCIMLLLVSSHKWFFPQIKKYIQNIYIIFLSSGFGQHHLGTSVVATDLSTLFSWSRKVKWN